MLPTQDVLGEIMSVHETGGAILYLRQTVDWLVHFSGGRMISAPRASTELINVRLESRQ